MSDVVAVSPKVSLNEALRLLSEILEIADEGLNDDESIASCLAVAGGNLSNAVDRRIGMVLALSGGTLSVDSAKGLIASLKEREEAVRRERKTLEKILLRIRESTMMMMQEHGVDVLSGSEGSFKLQSGVPSLQCDAPVYSKSYSNLIRPDDVLDFHIPSEYLTYEQIATLNKELIKEDLKRGVELPWSKLVYNQQIRMKSVRSLRG